MSEDSSVVSLAGRFKHSVTEMDGTHFVENLSPHDLKSLIEESGGYFCFVFPQKSYLGVFLFHLNVTHVFIQVYIRIDKINCILGSKLHHYMHVI